MKRIVFTFALAAGLVGPWSSLGFSAAGKNVKIPVELYVMSQCPFGVQAENAFFPALKILGGYVDFQLHYIGNTSTTTENGVVKTTLTSMHGQGEVDENIRQLCVEKHAPQSHFDYILERNKNYRETNWKTAAEAAKLDLVQIDKCASGPEGQALLAKDFAVAAAKGIGGSPTVFVDGQPYKGARGAKSIGTAICQALAAKGVSDLKACKDIEALPADPAPAAGGGGGCGDGGAPGAPAPFVFNARVITDKSCSFCTPGLVETIKASHPGVKITLLDVSAAETKELLKKYRIEAVPAYILDKSVEQDPNFARLASFYSKVEDAYVILPGPNTYLPTVQLNRQRVPNHMDIFVEPLSPLTTAAENEFSNFVLDTKVKDLSFSFHYIVQETPRTDKSAPPASARKAASLLEAKNSLDGGPLASARGDWEVQESLRQICRFQHDSIGGFLSYLGCRSNSLNNPTPPDYCLKANDAVQKCQDGSTGMDLLRQDARLARDLGITTGPMIMWENRYGPFGWHEVDWRALIEAK